MTQPFMHLKLVTIGTAQALFPKHWPDQHFLLDSKEDHLILAHLSSDFCSVAATLFF